MRKEDKKQDNTIKVQQDGRLILPKRFILDKGLSPRQAVDLLDVDLKKQGKHQNAFFRFMSRRSVVIGLLGLAAARIADVDGTLSFFKRMGWYDPEADKQLLNELFGVGFAKSGALIPAANHPFKPAPIGDTYPTERKCCEIYMARFHGNADIRTVPGNLEIKEDDSLILFGSQVSNFKTRSILGNPFGRDEPHLHLMDKSGWRTRLWWNLYTPRDAPTIERQQFGGMWMTKNHMIGDGSRDNTYQSRTRGYLLEDDYLLISALPRFKKGSQRILVFAGAHGPGQMATNLLLGGTNNNALRALEKKIEGEPYYQALFHVPVVKDEDGELRPSDIRLIDAKKLHVVFAR